MSLKWFGRKARGSKPDRAEKALTHAGERILARKAEVAGIQEASGHSDKDNADWKTAERLFNLVDEIGASALTKRERELLEDLVHRSWQ